MKKEKGMLICKTNTGFEFGIKQSQYKEEGEELIDSISNALMITKGIIFNSVNVYNNGIIVNHDVTQTL